MLLFPWVMSARISDSRSVRPSPRPGQFSAVAAAGPRWRVTDHDLTGVRPLPGRRPDRGRPGFSTGTRGTPCWRAPLIRSG